MGKKLAIALLIIILIGGGVYLFLLGGKQKMADTNGNKLNYSMDEIAEKGLTGAFVLNPDDTLSPAPAEMPGYAGAIEELDQTRYVWYADTNQDISGLIPTASRESKLVIVYNENAEIPEKFYLEKYGFRGYTFGTHFYTDLDKSIYIDSQDSLADSQAASIFLTEDMKSETSFVIDSISNSDTLPIHNVNNSIGVFLGVEKDKLYDISFYIGTYAKTATLKADTLAFQASQYIELTSPVEKTTGGYFIVNLPANLRSGFYYLSDIGFFRYSDE